MPYDTVDRGKIEQMVKEFYTIIILDDLVGPFFIRALGRDLKNDKWYEHLNTLTNFWMLMMEGETKNYWGDPFPPHAFLGHLSAETFERWLELFHGVVYRLFVPDIADKFYKKANTLAKQFQENLRDDEDEDW